MFQSVKICDINCSSVFLNWTFRRVCLERNAPVANRVTNTESWQEETDKTFSDFSFRRPCPSKKVHLVELIKHQFSREEWLQVISTPLVSTQRVVDWLLLLIHSYFSSLQCFVVVVFFFATLQLMVDLHELPNKSIFIVFCCRLRLLFSSCFHANSNVTLAVVQVAVLCRDPSLLALAL